MPRSFKEHYSSYSISNSAATYLEQDSRDSNLNTAIRMLGSETLAVVAASEEVTAFVRSSNTESSQRMIVSNFGVNCSVQIPPYIRNALSGRAHRSESPVFIHSVCNSGTSKDSCILSSSGSFHNHIIPMTQQGKHSLVVLSVAEIFSILSTGIYFILRPRHTHEM